MTILILFVQSSKPQYLHYFVILSYTFQSRHVQPKEDRIDHYRPQGEEFDKAYTYDVRSRTDETEISQQHVSSEKISVSRRDITRLEETEKPRYPKDLDIGRIVIEELPEEKEVTQSELVHKDELKLREGMLDTCYAVKNIPKKYVREDVKVGKLDITDYEVQRKDFEQTTTTRGEDFEKDSKVTLILIQIYIRIL